MLQVSPWLPQTVNQTDRIQGMARFMNSDGSSFEVMTLLLILAGMVTLILILKGISSYNQKKREKQFQKRQAKKKEAEARAMARKGEHSQISLRRRQSAKRLR